MSADRPPEFGAGDDRPRRAPAGVVRRRRIAALIFLLATVAAIAFLAVEVLGDDGERPEQGLVTLAVAGQKPVQLSLAKARLIAAGRRPLPVPATQVLARGSAEITYQLNRRGARRRIAAAAVDGGRVEIERRPVASRIKAPIVTQVYPNNCETAALEMLLATKGLRRDQLALQREIDRDGPLDPRTAADGTRIWGNPRYGFVGRAEGGGVAGGFGVYPKPVLRLARRFTPAQNLSGLEPTDIYRRLLHGNAVLVWIGLSAGPYESWRGPRGEEVTVNFGEHTVLLRGLVDGQLLVNDPLSGERLRWSKEEFEDKWDLLGRRAISA